MVDNKQYKDIQTKSNNYSTDKKDSKLTSNLAIYTFGPQYTR